MIKGRGYANLQNPEREWKPATKIRAVFQDKLKSRLRFGACKNDRPNPSSEKSDRRCYDSPHRLWQEVN